MQDQAAKRSEFLITELSTKIVIEFIERSQCLHDVIGLVKLFDVAVVIHIEFILDLTDDLLKDIFNRHRAANTTIFINHDGHVLSRFTELFKQHVQSLTFRDKGCGADEILDVETVLTVSQ